MHHIVTPKNCTIKIITTRITIITPEKCITINYYYWYNNIS